MYIWNCHRNFYCSIFTISSDLLYICPTSITYVLETMKTTASTMLMALLCGIFAYTSQLLIKRMLLVYNALMLSLARTVGPLLCQFPQKWNFSVGRKRLNNLKLARVGENIYFVLENNIFTQSKIKNFQNICLYISMICNVIICNIWLSVKKPV